MRSVCKLKHVKTSGLIICNIKVDKIPQNSNVNKYNPFSRARNEDHPLFLFEECEYNTIPRVVVYYTRCNSSIVVLYDAHLRVVSRCKTEKFRETRDEKLRKHETQGGEEVAGDFHATPHAIGKALSLLRGWKCNTWRDAMMWSRRARGSSREYDMWRWNEARGSRSTNSEAPVPHHFTHNTCTRSMLNARLFVTINFFTKRLNYHTNRLLRNYIVHIHYVKNVIQSLVVLSRSRSLSLFFYFSFTLVIAPRSFADFSELTLYTPK